MWLLKLHFSVSVLCFLSVIGLKMVFRKQFKRFPPKKTKLYAYLIYFCPITNLLVVVTACIMAFCDDDFASEMVKKITEE